SRLLPYQLGLALQDQKDHVLLKPTQHGVSPRAPGACAAHLGSLAMRDTLPAHPCSEDTRVSDILGIHHVTAIASDPQRNVDFYAGVLGLRLVKRTVNFDDPQTYHLYYGDEVGTPGSIMTFFP